MVEFRQEHAHPINRLFHFVGICLSYVLLGYSVVTGYVLGIVLFLLPFACCSIIGHKLIERN